MTTATWKNDYESRIRKNIKGREWMITKEIENFNLWDGHGEVINIVLYQELLNIIKY